MILIGLEISHANINNLYLHSFFLILLAVCSEEVLKFTSHSQILSGKGAGVTQLETEATNTISLEFKLLFGNHDLAYIKKETMLKQEHCLHEPTSNRRWMLSLGVPRPLPTGVFATPAPRARAADVPATTQGEMDSAPAITEHAKHHLHPEVAGIKRSNLWAAKSEGFRD